MVRSIRKLRQLSLFVGGIIVLTGLTASPSFADAILFQQIGNTINEIRGGLGGTVFGTCTEPLAGPCIVTVADGNEAVLPSITNFNIFEDPSLTTLGATLSISLDSSLDELVIGFFAGPGVTALSGPATSLLDTGAVETVATISFGDLPITPFDLEFETNETVPEPSSLLLLAAPLLGLVFRRRLAGRRQHSSV
jgi:hypothetical protein